MKSQVGMLLGKTSLRFEFLVAFDILEEGIAA